MNKIFHVTTLVLALVSAGAGAAPLITNGDFETGDLSGWTAVNQAGGNTGSFYIDSTNGYTPLSARPSAGPASGQFYAVSDSIGEGAHVLYQSFTLAAASRLNVRFSFFVNDYTTLNGSGSPSVNAAGLDFTAIPNQHARVDILRGDASAFETGSAVLANLYLGTDAGLPANPYSHYDLALSSVFAAGSYLLRFADVSNVDFLNSGVDDVSITATSAVPEPGSLPLAALGALAIIYATRRHRSPNPST